MLPGPLVSIYQQYKKDTNSVASWLASTARACGYPADHLSSGSWDVPPPTRSGRQKGKARKTAARNANKADVAPSKYIVALADFLPLAKFISSTQNKSVSVPDVVSTTIHRLIAVRSSFGARLVEHGVELDTEADARHDYFVGVLGGTAATTTAAAAAAAPIRDATDSLANRFAALTMCEPCEAFLSAPDTERPQPVARDKTVYEAESPTSVEDVMFAFCAMIEDLSRIRSVIIWIWAEYGKGVFDLAASAVATNTATELARGLIEDVLPAFKDYGGTWAVLNKFYIASCAAKGFFAMDDLFVDSQNAAGNGDNFNHDWYKITDDLYMISYHTLLGYCGTLGPRDLPIMKEGFFSKYDAASDPESKTGKQRAEEDKMLLVEFLSELMALVRLARDYPVQDDFLRGLREMDQTHQVPFYLVFAAQVFLDIHHTLRAKAATGSSKMLAETSIMGQELQNHIDFHQKLKAGHWSAENEQALRQLLGEINWITKDPIYRAKVRLLHHLGVPVMPTIQPHRLLEFSPVLAGLVLFDFCFRTHKMGLSVANTWGSIQYTAHLYHALLDQKLLREPWPDMDVAKALLKNSSFFVGNPPTSPEGYLKKFSLQIGASISVLANPKQRKNQKDIDLISRAGPRGIKDGLPVSSIFANRYLGGSGQMDWTPEQVDEIIARSEFDLEGTEEDGVLMVYQLTDAELKKRAQQAKASNSNSSKGKGKNKDKPKTLVSSDQLVKLLVLALHGETIHMAFPYLTLHRSCWRLLRAVKRSCDAVLRELYAPAYMEREIELPFVVGYAFLTACGEWGIPGDMRRFRDAAEAVNALSDTEELTAALDVYRNMGHQLEIRRKGFMGPAGKTEEGKTEEGKTEEGKTEEGKTEEE